MHFFVSLTLSGAHHFGAKQKSANIDVDAWLCVFRPAVCLLVVTLYLFASLHKLNSTYISEQGFAPTIYRSIISNEQLLAFSQLFPTDAAFIAILPLLSVLIELAIPILLLFRRTRLIAILIGMSFHIILSLRSYPFVTDFPIFLGAAFVLSCPRPAVDLINVSISGTIAQAAALVELYKA